MSNALAIDYTSKDFTAFKAAMLDYASRVLPDWQSRSEGDFGVVLVELMAYEGDILSYYGDRLQAEAFLPTATQRLSLVQISQLLGYTPALSIPATGTVTFQTSNPGVAVTIPAGTAVVTDYVAEVDGPITYETIANVTVPLNGGTATVGVVQGITRTAVNLGTSTGLAQQQIRVPEIPIIADSIAVQIEDVDGSLVDWAPISNLLDAGPNDKVFATFQDEQGALWIEFGDNLNGAVPGVGLIIFGTYRAGGGAFGNIAAGLVTNFADSAIAGVAIQLDVNNVPVTSAMSGGADPETIEQIRTNAPRVFRTQNRAVTLQDFADLALKVPGVARAKAVAGTFTSVTVYVVGPNGGTPPQTLLNQVSALLTPACLAGTSLTITVPSVVAVNVGTVGTPIAVQVYPRYKRSAVEYNVQQAIKTLLSFSNVDFGTRLTVSDFYAAIMSVEGVQYVAIPMIARADAVQSGTADMVFRDWEIPILGSLNTTSTGGIG